MIPRLVKRDPVWQIAWLLTVALAAAAPVVSLGDTLDLVLLPTMAIMVCSVVVRPHVHATLFEAALPIAGRDLFLARTLSLLAIVWLPVLSGAAGILLVRGNGPRALAMLGTGAIVTPVILAQQGIGVREFAGPRWSGFVWVPIWVAGGLAWHFQPHAIVLSLSGLVSTAILIRAWFAVPPSFQIVSLDVASPTAVPESVPAVPLARTAFTWLPVLRSMFGGQTAWYFAAMVALGMFGAWYSFLPILTVMGTLRSRQRSCWLSALPLSYRGLLAITLASAAVPLLAGVAVGMLIRPSHVDISMSAGPRSETPTPINVALEFWRSAPGGEGPLVQAPWGETAKPATFRVIGFTFYNPYSVGPGNTRQFHDWQFERASQTVYGRSIPSDQVDAARQAGLKPLTDQPRMRILTWETAVLFALFLVFATELGQWHRLRRLSVGVRVAVISAVFGIPVAAYGIDLYYLTRDSALISQALLHFGLLRLTNALTNPVLAVSAATVPICVMYWLLERQFRKSEVVRAASQGRVG